MTKAKRKQQWLAEYETQLVERKPELTGKVDWNTAIYLYNLGISVEKAVDNVCKKDKTDIESY